MNRISPTAEQLEEYISYSVKNFNGNDHISNSVVINKDIDLRYLYVDGIITDPNRSSFWGSYWYCIDKQFLSRNKYKYTLKRDVFQPLDFLLANNNVPITSVDQTYTINDRWLTEDAYIERGVTTSDLRFRKDNLPLNVVKVDQREEVPSQPMIGIFYKQRENENNEEIDFNLVANISSSVIYDYEETNINAGTVYYADINNLSNGSLYQKSRDNYSERLCQVEMAQVTYGRYADLVLSNSNLTNNYVTRTDKFVNVAVMGTADWNVNAVLYFNQQDLYAKSHLTGPIINGISEYESIMGQLCINRSTIQNSLLSKTGLSQVPTLRPGIIKDGDNYYRRTVESTMQSVTFTRSDLRSMLPASPATLRQMFDSYRAIGEDNDITLTCTYPRYKVTTTSISTPIEHEAYKIAAETDYPNMNNTPCKCIAIDYNVENWTWATNLTMMPEVIDVQVIKYPRSSWRSQLSLQDEHDDIESISISDDEVTKYHSLTTPIPPGNKEYSRCRLYSGSWKDYIELDTYQNNGLSQVVIEYRLKPYQTTYYINPVYSGSYGNTFNDKRALIESESLSSAALDDAWVNYQYNNRTYMDAFNRQQDSLTLQQNWEERVASKELDISEWEARMQQGNYLKSVTGNLPLISDIVGAVGSWTGGQVSRDIMDASRLDYQMGQELRADALSLQRDMFNFGTGNIKALSPVVSRLDCLDSKTSFGFWIEILETTDAEKQSVANYKRWNGEPINAIGKFEDYINGSDTHLIQGTLIRSTYPPNILREINQGLKGGIYRSGV